MSVVTETDGSQTRKHDNKPMYTLETKQKFIELRVEGVSLARIAEEIKVPKTTLWHWDREHRDRIREIQLINQDEQESGWLATHEQRLEDLQEVTHYMHEALISKFRRQAEHLPIKELFLYLRLAREEMEHYRLKPFPQAENQQNPQTPELAHVKVLPAPNLATASGTPNEQAAYRKTEQKGTSVAKNGTPYFPAQTTSPGQMPANHGTSEQMVRIGTIFPENGTPASPALEQQRPPIHPTPQDEMVQNGTISPENGTTTQEPPLSNQDSSQVASSVSLETTNAELCQSQSAISDMPQSSGNPGSQPPPQP